MSTLKIVKNAQGHVVGFGPNEDFYGPSIPDGGTLEYGDTAEVYVPPPVPPTKDQRIGEILSVIPDLTRREVQAIIAITELNAKLELAINATPIATSLAVALLRNPSYKMARRLEDLCRVVDKS